MSEERISFERMMKQTLDRYFQNNLHALITGRILISDNGKEIKVYNKKYKRYDMLIVY